MSAFRRLLKNSAANVASGAANAILALLLPPVLVRHLSADVFSTWSVVLQIAAIVNLFGFGVQVAVGRYVAHCTASGQERLRQEIVSTAFAVLWSSALLAVGVLLVLAVFTPLLFPGMPQALHGPARLALLLVGASFAFSLPASVAAGVFTGFQRNELPAYVVVGSRIAIAAALVVTASLTGDLVDMAFAYAVINVAAAGVQLWLLHRIYPEIAFRRNAVTRQAARELVSYCTSLTIWSLGMLAIGGLDSVIAGRIDFHWAGYFAVAGSIVTIIVGVQAALLQPLVAVSAQLHSQGARDRLGELLIEATRTNALFFALSVLPLYLAGAPLLELWLGEPFAREVLPVAQVLLLGIYARQTLAPFATILLGTGEQRLVIVTVVYEGATKLILSIALGSLLGPIGVALGTLAGGLICLASNMVINFPRVTGFTTDVPRFLVHGIAMPTLVMAPMVAIAWSEWSLGPSLTLATRALTALAIVIAAAAMARPALGRLRELV